MITSASAGKGRARGCLAKKLHPPNGHAKSGSSQPPLPLTLSSPAPTVLFLSQPPFPFLPTLADTPVLELLWVSFFPALIRLVSCITYNTTRHRFLVYGVFWIACFGVCSLALPMHTHTRARTSIHGQSHTHRLSLSHTHTHTHSHMQAHTLPVCGVFSRACFGVCPLAVPMHTHSYKQTDTNTHTHAHTHTFLVSGAFEIA